MKTKVIAISGAVLIGVAVGLVVWQRTPVQAPPVGVGAASSTVVLATTSFPSSMTSSPTTSPSESVGGASGGENKSSASIPTQPLRASTEIMAWLYPSNTICTAEAEYSDGRVIQFLKPEYFTVAADGTLALLTQGPRGCNGYSAANVASVKAHSQYQFVTVSSGIDSMQPLVASPGARTAAITKLTTFVTTNNLTGIEIDFEDFGSWDTQTYTNYKLFLQELGIALHAQNKQLMVDVPPIGNSIEQSYYHLTYSDMNALPIDYIVVMAYDNQFDQGAGTPIAPNAWVSSIIETAQKAIPNSNRLVIGIPSYAYSGPTGKFSITRLTYDQLTSIPGFSTAPRDPSSYERMWTYNGKSYDYIDSAALDAKRALIESYGVKYISVWALGGNQWF